MRWPAVLAVVAAGIGGCGTDDAGPFDGLPVEVDVAADVTAPAHVARDHDGLAHIHARTLADAAFVQGYVMAHDRLPQMDVLRHLAAGTLAELRGDADPSVIDGDIVRRMFQHRALAAQAWADLQTRTDEVSVQLVTVLGRFSDGVNAYLHALRAATWTIDPAVADGFVPAATADWSPIDSLAIARWWTAAQSFTVPFELDATELYQQLRAFYDQAPETNAAGVARHGISRDLFKLLPIGTTPTAAGGFDAAAPLDTTVTRPPVDPALLDAARAFFAHDAAFRVPAIGGHAFTAEAPHGVFGAAIDLPLTNPALFYPTHLIVAPPAADQDRVVDDDDGAPAPEVALDAIGATIAGVPGVMIGASHRVAWASTASMADVNDLYLETGGVATTPDDQDIGVGALGQITTTIHVQYERVPGRGPIIPAIDPASHTLIPRAGAPALSLRTTSDQPLIGPAALITLARAADASDAYATLPGNAGGVSWTLLDHQCGNDWKAEAGVPQRAAATYGWDPLVQQDALAPVFVLPATDDAAWTGTATLPDVFDPIMVSANADPLGATFDGKPLNQVTDAGPLYLGAAYDVGLRQDRIAARLATATTLDDAAAIVTDTHSSIGEKFAPMLLAALGRLDRQAIGPPDVNPYLDALSADDLARLATARTLLQAWTFATPAEASDDSAATAVFHTWLHFFVERSIKDELDAIHFDVWQLDDNAILRVIYALLHDPNSFVTSPASQQPILCDNYAVSGLDDSCTKGILEATVDAMTYLASPAGFGDADVRHWRWGALHQIALAPWPGSTLRIPAEGGIERPGDPATVDRGNPGWADLAFAAHPRGSAYQLVAQCIPGGGDDEPGFALRATLAGGAIFDSRSPHYRDQLDRGYLTGQLLPLAQTVDQIVAAGETRWVFH